MSNKEIKKVLVANRGEIAIRVFRACYDMGLKTVAVYSKEDVFNLFRTKADEAYQIGENKSPLGAYLDIDRIIDLAKRKGVDAIHPGYGFLSENPAFAKACEDNDIIFVGPPSNVLAKMGDKLSAKEIAVSCNVPTIPGTETPLKNSEEAKEMAAKFGYPVILKAAAGGGGRGMRKIDSADEMTTAFEMVSEEARKAFGCGDIFMEKYLIEPRHIEVQILADQHGNIVHLYERDCSVQRRYQKVIEFAPAFAVSEQKRAELHSDALKIAKAVGYVNAGTVEFLLDQNGDHYFIEMNPRIQVEHTVTEMLTGRDLVKSQLYIAMGLPLSSFEIGIESQDDVKPSGYSIQCRVTTEDPRNNFAPDTGKITTYRSGGGYGIRLDAGNAFTGAEISPYYDSLLVKITTFDRTFIGTARKALRAIGEIRIRGVKTNIAFLSNILQHQVFRDGKCHTKFIDETPELFKFEDPQDRATKILKYLGNIIINDGSDSKEIYDKPRIPEYSEENIPLGLKAIFDKDGPEGLKKYVQSEKRLLIGDTTMRDAHQSLLATRVRTKDMVDIAIPTSHILANAFSLEMWGGATFDVAYRFLHESPWERLDELRKRIPNIPFQMLFRGANAVGYTNYPDNLIREFIREAAISGIDIFRIFDSLNWIPGMEVAIDEVLKQGKVAECSICYTGDICDSSRDKYNLKYYVNMAKELEKRGAHIIAIKDMAGLLKPYAAKELISALKDTTDLPIRLHTHDTTGNQISTILMAAEAGVDIVDTAISSMSSLTSQPSMNSLVAALSGQTRDPGFDLEELQHLTDYWEDVRKYYAPFQADLNSPVTDIYRYEIPGGQYTNLKPQVESLGLGHRFKDVKEKYREVNDMLGDIVKVTPSSKMVGDLAIFMVQNDLTSENITQKGQSLDYPDSVVSYFKGMMGQPPWGFPEDLQKIVLKGETPVTCRPGELLEPIDFDAVTENIQKYESSPTRRDLLGWCLYPKVLEDYCKHRSEYGYISRMDSHVFFMGLAPGETTEICIEDGKTLMIKYIGPGEHNEDGTINVIFELNGARREVAVRDKTAKVEASSVVLADPDDARQVGSSIPGAVSKVMVKAGEEVVENQVLAIIEAMKMETSVVSKKNGLIDKVCVSEGHSVKAGELLFTLKD
ncbi:MAG: pyruvate carboxylase [Spirochaetales bacterium]|nr:pyruvate carboxylase [Spirochaetales bacterium]